MGCGCRGNNQQRTSSASVRPKIIINPVPSSGVVAQPNTSVAPKGIINSPIVNKINDLNAKQMQKIRREAIRKALGR